MARETKRQLRQRVLELEQGQAAAVDRVLELEGRVVVLRAGELVLQRCTVAELEMIAQWIGPIDSSLGPVVVLEL